MSHSPRRYQKPLRHFVQVNGFDESHAELCRTKHEELDWGCLDIRSFLSGLDRRIPHRPESRTSPSQVPGNPGMKSGTRAWPITDQVPKMRELNRGWDGRGKTREGVKAQGRCDSWFTTNRISSCRCFGSEVCGRERSVSWKNGGFVWFFFLAVRGKVTAGIVL